MKTLSTRDLELRWKIIAVAILPTIILVAAFLAVFAFQRSRVAGNVESGMGRLTEENLARAARDLRTLCEATHREMWNQVPRSLRVARDQVQRLGDVTFAKETIPWSARNQLDGIDHRGGAAQGPGGRPLGGAQRRPEHRHRPGGPGPRAGRLGGHPLPAHERPGRHAPHRHHRAGPERRPRHRHLHPGRRSRRPPQPGGLHGAARRDLPRPGPGHRQLVHRRLRADLRRGAAGGRHALHRPAPGLAGGHPRRRGRLAHRRVAGPSSSWAAPPTSAASTSSRRPATPTARTPGRPATPAATSTCSGSWPPPPPRRRARR